MARVGPPSSSDAARHTTQLVQQLAHSLLFERSGRRTTSTSAGAQAAPSEAQIHGAVRLCIRILTSHIGEPLMVEDEASIAQAIRTKLAKVCVRERKHHDTGGLFQNAIDPFFEFPSHPKTVSVNKQPHPPKMKAKVHG